MEQTQDSLERLTVLTSLTGLGVPTEELETVTGANGGMGISAQTTSSCTWSQQVPKPRSCLWISALLLAQLSEISASREVLPADCT